MISTNKLKKRNVYLNKLIQFQDTEPVKVVTGIRRCGKSSLLKLMAEHLRNSGIKDEQIIEMDFEKYEFGKMTGDSFYKYVKDRILPDPNKRLYLFFDEIQRVPQWENAVNSFRVELNCDIYITGSNAYLLSSEYATYLAGRYVEIKMLPLSFSEFIYFHDLRLEEITGVLGQKKKQFRDKNGTLYDLNEVFEAYLRFGGMPGISEVGLDQEKALVLLDGIYSTVVMRDILEKKVVSDPILLRKIIMFLADNIGSNISVSSIGNVLVNEGLLEDRRKKSAPSAHTVQTYVNALLESYIFYETKRFDIKGKDYLRTLSKYYIVDIGIRNYLLGFRDRDSGHILENVVYFELIRRGYDVAIGKVDKTEVDFVATKADDKKYIQVTESMLEKTVCERELAPLQRINDNYEKIILSLNPGIESSYEGIKSLNVIDWLLDF